jgi:type IV pilus assembly protein PilY1
MCRAATFLFNLLGGDIMSFIKSKQIIAGAAIALAMAASGAQAGQVITSTNGLASIGVQDLGALGFGSVGVSFAGNGDGIMPGCLCEGWGASGNGVAGWSANDNGGNVNVSLASALQGAGFLTSVVNVGALQVTQAYAASAASGALIRDHVTLTNTSGATMTDARYSRSMDWDIPPTTFSELVTIGGVGATRLKFSNDNGFATPNPLSNPGSLVGGTTNVNFVRSGPSDHGNEALALAALGDVGAEVYSLGENNRTSKDGVTYAFGFAGVGGTSIGHVPEPGSMALFGLAFAGLAWNRRRKV